MYAKICVNLATRPLRRPNLRLRQAKSTASRCLSTTRKHLPTRDEHILALSNYDFDVLVIGGGATGAGCALDAATRGLRTALIDADDFGNGSSSKTTKLLQTGIRHLQLGSRNFSGEQFRLVKEFMRERAILMTVAPHLCQPLPILLPIYHAWQSPMYWLGLKFYDVLTGGPQLKAPHFITRDKVLEEFPFLRKESLRGGIVYYDGQFDDARLCVSQVLTAAQHGASVVNHLEVIELLKQESICRYAHVRDCLTAEQFYIQAKCIINATGAGTDRIRQLDSPNVTAVVQHSSATHIVLPQLFCSRKYGLVVPTASDGRTLFMLPWQGYTVAGKCESASSEGQQPEEPLHPTHGAVESIMNNIYDQMEDDVCLEDRHIRSAWTCINAHVGDARAVAVDGDKQTQLLEVSSGNLVTVVGQSWSSHRSLAKDVIDTAIECCVLEPARPCCTDTLPLAGAQEFTPNLAFDLMQNFDLPVEVAQHLTDSYGTNGFTLLIEAPPDMRARLHPDLPYIEAEIPYACRHEYACTVVDVMARRLRVAFLDAQLAYELLPKLIDIMTYTLYWCPAEQRKQSALGEQFLRQQMGLGDIVEEQPKREAVNKVNLGQRQYTVHRGAPAAAQQAMALGISSASSGAEMPLQLTATTTTTTIAEALTAEQRQLLRKNCVKSTSAAFIESYQGAAAAPAPAAQTPKTPPNAPKPSTFPGTPMPLPPATPLVPTTPTSPEYPSIPKPKEFPKSPIAPASPTTPPSIQPHSQFETQSHSHSHSHSQSQSQSQSKKE